MAIRKKFSPQLYQENDEPACNAVLSYLNKNGSYAIRNDDKYGPDIVLFRGFKPKQFIECEVKRVWRADQDSFPWATVQLPERKLKFIGLGLPIEFWILRDDLKFAMVICDGSIVSERLVEVPNKMVSAGERFFQVPTEECNIIQIGG